MIIFIYIFFYKGEIRNHRYLSPRFNLGRTHTHTPTVLGGGWLEPPTPPTHTPPIALSLPYDILKSFYDSVLCRLQNDVNIMGYISKWRCWGPVTSSNIADFFTLFTFSTILFFFPPEHLTQKIHFSTA